MIPSPLNLQTNQVLRLDISHPHPRVTADNQDAQQDVCIYYDNGTFITWMLQNNKDGYQATVDEVLDQFRNGTDFNNTCWPANVAPIYMD